MYNNVILCCLLRYLFWNIYLKKSPKFICKYSFHFIVHMLVVHLCMWIGRFRYIFFSVKIFMFSPISMIKPNNLWYYTKEWNKKKLFTTQKLGPINLLFNANMGIGKKKLFRLTDINQIKKSLKHILSLFFFYLKMT